MHTPAPASIVKKVEKQRLCTPAQLWRTQSNEDSRWVCFPIQQGYLGETRAHAHKEVYSRVSVDARERAIYFIE